MVYYVIKLVITAVLIVLISEISKRSSFVGAILASVPLVSVLAMLWLYIETKDAEKISVLATSIFWLVIPSLALFITLPLLLKQSVNFYLSLGMSIAITAGCYFIMVAVLNRYGVKL
ncbi:MAG: DUF3147 family protein [Gammaproteobacteria bacterium]|nr:DUF3147 family protein [Gammaproteobacteria bacterium]